MLRQDLKLGKKPVAPTHLFHTDSERSVTFDRFSLRLSMGALSAFFFPPVAFVGSFVLGRFVEYDVDAPYDGV